MKLRNFPHKRRILGLLLAPLALWVGLVCLVPTGAVRRRIIDEAQRAIGHEVSLDSVCFCFCGGLKLSGLRVGPEEKPWLEIQTIATDLTLLDGILGKRRPSRVDASGITLTLITGPNGLPSLDHLPDLTGKNRFRVESEREHGRDTETGKESRNDGDPINFALTDAQIHLVNESTGERVTLTDLAGEGTYSEDVLRLTSLRGLINGGRLSMVGLVDRSAPTTQVECHLRLEHVAVTQPVDALGLFVPLVLGDGMQLSGMLDFEMLANSKGKTAEDLLANCAGRGTFSLDPIRLHGSPLFHSVGAYLPLADQDDNGRMQGRFQIRDQRVEANSLNLAIGSMALTLNGWTSFDGYMKYAVRTQGLEGKLQRAVGRLPKEAQQLVEGLPSQLDDLTGFTVEGSKENLTVSFDGIRLDGRDDLIERLSRPAERERLREIGRRLKDRLIR